VVTGTFGDGSQVSRNFHLNSLTTAQFAKLKYYVRGQIEARMTYNCSLYSAGKQAFGNYESLSLWRYEAVDNSKSGVFAAGTIWGISFPKLPDLFIGEPRSVFLPLLEKNQLVLNELADDDAMDIVRRDTAKFPVLTRRISATTDANRFAICFIATTVENQGTAEQNLIGVALIVEEKTSPGVYVRIDAKLLVAPALGQTRGTPKEYEKEKITRMF
jgi:hypothetical protein